MEDCNKISKDTKDLMFSLIDKSEKVETWQYREHYIDLCEDKDGNIQHSNICVGGKIKFPEEGSKKQEIRASVSYKKIATCQCPADTNKIGSFHTHPWGDFSPSKPDIVGSAINKHKLMCIGSRSDTKPYEWIEELKRFRYTDKIICYGIVDEELLRLGNEAQELSQTNEEAQELSQTNIDKIKKDILPLAFDRVKNIKPLKMPPRNILKVKCKIEMTK